MAGFIAGVVYNKDTLSNLIYADVVAHLSTTQLGTIDAVNKEKADDEYLKAQMSVDEVREKKYVHRTFDNV